MMETGFRKYGNRRAVAYMLLCVLVLLLPVSEGKAQNYHFKRYTSEEGLYVNTINKIVQDKEGAIWVGSFDGLHRFNGYSFQLIRNQKRAEELITGNEIRGLYADNKNRIWVGTIQGLSMFSYLNGKARIFSGDTGENTLQNSYVTSFGETADKVWMGTPRGLAYFSETDSSIHRTNHPVLSKTGIRQIIVSRNFLYVVSNDGVFKTPLKAEKWEQLPIRGQVSRICISRDERVLVWDGIKELYWLLPDGTQEYFPNLPIEGNVTVMLLEGQNHLWIGTREGLILYGFKDRKYRVFKHEAFNNNSLSSSDILDLFQDQYGLIWVATVAGGVNVFDPRIENFNLMSSPVYQGRGVFNNAISSFTEDAAGILYVGTAKGLSIFDPINETVKTIGIAKSKEDGLLVEWVRSLCTSNDNKIWIATAGGGISVYHNSKFKHYLPDTTRLDQGLPSAYVYNVYKARNGKIYAATARGIACYNPVKDCFENMEQIPAFSFIKKQIVWKVLEDRKGRFLITMPAKGVYRVNAETGALDLFGTDAEAQIKIIDNPVWSMLEDEEGRLWFGTNHGLSIYEETKGTVAHFNTMNGLPDDVIYGFLTDRNHHVWMSSNKGIIRYIPESGTFLQYTTNDGLQSNEFNQEAFYKSPAGTMYFGGVKGYNFFNPEKIGVQRLAPVCFISDVSRQTGQQRTSLPPDHKSLQTLGYLQDILHIEFGILDYYHAAKAQYRYKIRELDNNWISGGNNNRVIYSNLPPGKYHFLVQASINGTDWSAFPAELFFVVKPPFYRTWWFMTFLIILLLVFTYLLYLLRVGQIKRKAEVQMQISELRMAALRAQMNPHFIFNALNSIQHLVIKNDTQQAYSYLSKFSKLLRMVLEMSDKTFIKLEKEVEILNLYLDLEKLRFGRQLNVYFELDEEEDWSGLKIPTLMLQPFVENAIWHGILPKVGTKKLWIRIKMREQNLEIEIEDNGIGRKKSAELNADRSIMHTSKSTMINETRLSLIGENYGEQSKIEIIDLYEGAEPAGTLVRIVFPVQALLIYE